MTLCDYMDEVIGDSRDLGEQVKYCCPFCPPNSDYKLYVNNTTTEKNGLWTCFKCGSKGNPVTFAMKFNNCGYQEAKDILELYIEDQTLLEYREQGLTTEEIVYLMFTAKASEEKETTDKLSPPPLPKGLKYFQDNLNNPEAQPFLKYLIEKRNIPLETILHYFMGYIVNGSAKTNQGKTVPIRNHVVFFTFDNDGKYQYWNTRSIDPNPMIKTFNAMAQDDTQYSKSQLLFNLNVARNNTELVIVEGVIDALTIGEKAVAGFGKKLSDTQIDLIKKAFPKETKVYVMLDTDAFEQAEELAMTLLSYFPETYIVVNQTGKDPNDMGSGEAWRVIREQSIHASSPNKFMLHFGA